jgi:hypothetical protein
MARQEQEKHCVLVPLPIVPMQLLFVLLAPNWFKSTLHLDDDEDK